MFLPFLNKEFANLREFSLIFIELSLQDSALFAESKQSLFLRVESFLFFLLNNSLRFLRALWVSAVNKTQALLSLTLYLDK